MANIQIKDGSENVYPKINNVVKQFRYSGSAPDFSTFIMNALGTIHANLSDGEIGMIYGQWEGHNHFLFSFVRLSSTSMYYRVSDNSNMYIGLYEVGTSFELHVCSMAN